MNHLADVSTLILIGRPEPSPAAIEQQARLLYGREVIDVASHHPERKGYYPRRKRGLAIRDSAELAIVDCTFHPDPAAETLRWAACEGELMQALHRARPINRTAANPLRIVLATNVPLPLEVDLISSWDGLQPLLAERMLALSGAALFAPTDMALAFPDLFPSAEAAKKALQRERGRQGQFSNRRLLLGMVPGFGEVVFPLKAAGCYRLLSPSLMVRYRRAGAPMSAVPMVFDPDRITDPFAWLRIRLRCDVVRVETAVEQERS